MRCLHALGDWEPLCQLARDTWGSAQLDDERGDELSMQNRAEVARLAAAGAWNLRLWGEMEHYCASMPADTVETSFFRAVLAVHGDEFSAARLHIDEARRQLDSEFTALVGESYNRAYRIMIEVLQMSELEEIILHKERPVAMPLAHLCRMWQERVNAAQCDAEVWQDILSVRDLAAPPTKETRTWLKFCRLCLRSGRSTQSRKILVQLIGYEPTRGQPFPPALSPPVALAYVKQLWVEGARDEALERVRAFVADPRMTQDPKLAAKAFIKCGQWQQEYYTSGRAGAALAAPSGAPPAVGRGGSGGDWRDGPGTEPLDEAHTAAVLESLRRASELDPKSYKAWHTWAMVNFEAVGSPTGDGSRYVVPAIAGFFRSIALGRERALQDTLRLLTMWFKYGATPAVDEAVQRGFLAIPIDTWLLVTPQIIAHIHSSTTLVRRSVHTLLCRVAKAHPQGLVYPLTVASKSQSMPRQRAAQRVLAEMRKQCDRLVEQAALVSVELIRTSILWHEMWHTALEDASRMYFGAQDVDGMLETLLPLHQMLQRGPETMRESSFQQAFGAELQRAHELCQQYKLTLARTDLHAAWDIYYAVFRRISKQIAKFTVLELQHVSPKLQEARDLELAVPGTYQAGCPVVRIREFARSMTVIASKQRPRKLTVNGSDGSRHAFLLKGHEDLRQDERVMQLFGLVNTLLSTDRDTSTKDLAIQRYSVVPLSPNSGLISWVAQCDTLHALIKDFRDTRKILLNIEHRLMLQMAPDYDGLPVLNKLEVFVHTLDNSGGHDLARVLWLRSRNAEHWLQRRTTYTRSLAVMSMVGYILGLGDRHPSNLMLDRLTGKILHIDFGDCFEVAVHRDKFPEKIPFRLTRMLVNAMEVSGIEGNFRSTCEAVMSMLRNNKDSVLAMLEAFVHDPLINWRLLARPSPSASSTGGRSRAASHVETRSRGASNVSSSAADARGRARATSMGAVDPATARAGLPEDVVRLLAELDADPERGRDLGPSPEAEGGREVWNHPAAVIGTPRSEDGVRDGGGKSAIAASRRSMRERIEPLQQQDEQVLNERALSVLRRVKTKLAGTDFPDQRLEVEAQVDLLVREAQSDLNLCQLYVGWCPFW
jgi:FKBP12-rapamycin complex-associated protein